MGEDAIIPTPQAQQAIASAARLRETKFICGAAAKLFRRYCYEEEFREAAPRQCDGGVRQQSDSLRSLLIENCKGLKQADRNRKTQLKLGGKQL